MKSFRKLRRLSLASHIAGRIQIVSHHGCTGWPSGRFIYSVENRDGVGAAWLRQTGTIVAITDCQIPSRS